MKGFNEQKDVEHLLQFYTKLCTQEKEKLIEIRARISEREEIQVRINSILDQAPIEPVKQERPTTHQAKRENMLDNPFDKII